MHFLSNEVSKVQEYNLEVLGFNNDVLKKYPVVEKGYLFHFYLGDHSIMTWDDSDYQFNLDFNWKLFWPGPLDRLEKRLEEFKNKLIQHREMLVNDLDQFGYLYLFIIKSENMYELVISSDSFGFDTINAIITKKS